MTARQQFYQTLDTLAALPGAEVVLARLVATLRAVVTAAEAGDLQRADEILDDAQGLTLLAQALPGWEWPAEVGSHDHPSE